MVVTLSWQVEPLAELICIEFTHYNQYVAFQCVTKINSFHKFCHKTRSCILPLSLHHPLSVYIYILSYTCNPSYLVLGLQIFWIRTNFNFPFSYFFFKFFDMGCETELWLVVLFFFSATYIQLCVVGEPQVPCLFIFGDSLSDSGNNNHLSTDAKVNYMPYGIDFPAGATGRFTNGRTSVDIISNI